MAEKLQGTNPSNAVDATHKLYVDKAIFGSAKPSATVVATSALPACSYDNGSSGYNATITMNATGTTSVDGHTLAANDVVLVTAQSLALQNGLYTVTTAGATGVATVLTRHSSMNNGSMFVGGVVNVYGGTSYANSVWFCTNASTPVIGTNNVTFTQLSLADIAPPLADFSMNSHKITNLLDPSSAQDIATKNYFDNGTVTMTGKTLTNPTINSYTEGVVSIGTVTTSATLSLTNGTLQTATLTASTACTFTMPTAVAGKSFVLMLKQAAATGNGSATFTGVKWNASGAPTITAAAGKMDILTFFSDGTDWFGSITQNYSTGAGSSIVYDAIGAGVDFFNSLSWTHSAASGAYVLCFIYMIDTSTLGDAVTGVTYGGTAMTRLAAIGANNSNANGLTYMYGLASVASGSKTVTVTISDSQTNISGTANTISYTGVSTVGSPATAFGSSAAPSQAMTQTAGTLVHGFGLPLVAVNSDSGGTERYKFRDGSNNSILIQDSSASTTFSASTSATDPWSGVGVQLS